MKPTPPKPNGPPPGGKLLPRHASRFASVADLMRKGDDAEAFRRAALTCVDKAEALAPQLGGLYPTLKLAIELHRHALFVSVAQDKSRTQHDAAAYAAYQKYLAGETDVPVAVGLPQGVAPDAPPDVDAETADDEEDK